MVEGRARVRAHAVEEAAHRRRECPRLERLAGVPVAELARPRDEPGLEDAATEQHDLPLLPRKLVAQRGQGEVGVVPRHPRGLVVEPGVPGRGRCARDHCAAAVAGVNRAPFSPRAAAVTLRGMDQTSELIGSSPRREEDRRLLVGAGRYLDDMTPRGVAPPRRGAQPPRARAHPQASTARRARAAARRGRGVERRRPARGGAAHPRRRRRARTRAGPSRRPSSRSERRPLRGRVRGRGGGRRSLSPGRRRSSASRSTTSRCPRLVTAEAALASRAAPARGLAGQCRGRRPRAPSGDAEQALAGARRGRERALPPRAPRRGVHRDARRARLSRSGHGPARPLVVHAEPVLDPRRRRAHRRRCPPRRSACSRPTWAAASAPRARPIPRRCWSPLAALRLGRPGEVDREPARGFRRRAATTASRPRR